jgi:hypothetical protein
MRKGGSWNTPPRRRVPPAVVCVTWWFLPRGDGLRRAVADGARPGQGGPRSVLCDFGDGVAVGAWRAWPTHADREYDGADAGRALLTVRRSVAAFFRSGRHVDSSRIARSPGGGRFPAAS